MSDAAGGAATGEGRDGSTAYEGSARASTTCGWIGGLGAARPAGAGEGADPARRAWAARRCISGTPIPRVIMCNGTATRPRTAPGPNLIPACAGAERKTDKPAAAKILKIARRSMNAWSMTARPPTVLRPPAVPINDQTGEKFLAGQGNGLGT